MTPAVGHTAEEPDPLPPTTDEVGSRLVSCIPVVDADGDDPLEMLTDAHQCRSPFEKPIDVVAAEGDVDQHRPVDTPLLGEDVLHEVTTLEVVADHMQLEVYAGLRRRAA